MIAIGGSAGASKLVGDLAGSLRASAAAQSVADARRDWHRISLLGTVAYLDDRDTARGAPPGVQKLVCSDAASRAPGESLPELSGAY